jgi:predicted negative regulator of RcsB-dependent stress response
MAKKRRPSSRSTPRGTADDTFTAGVLEFTAWARERTEVLIAGLVVVLLLVGGGLYWANQRAEQRARAAAELESLQQTVAFMETDEAIGDLRGYLARYGGTPYGGEARLVLGEILLEEGRADEAISVLQEMAPSFRNPLRIQATILLATAYEEAEQWAGAAEVYQALSRNAELSYQRRDATEGLARVHLAMGDSASAMDAYRRLLDEMEADEPARGYFEMRLAELTGGDPS